MTLLHHIIIVFICLSSGFTVVVMTKELDFVSVLLFKWLLSSECFALKALLSLDL